MYEINSLKARKSRLTNIIGTVELVNQSAPEYIKAKLEKKIGCTIPAYQENLVEQLAEINKAIAEKEK